ncbi:hypothetical protein [Flavivirga eckloniae]|uniref:Uncharacterized protein n=1 Tax=Flavivirga eckloniae TaxID=1803846 RepID=A0A2K9PVU1_9FLAO|nr:hypothetical protein [Flavivirga eckloniae]AUP81185.1 hypothetical protein C1H87_21700 [Flavivirga eckloniae]
MSYDLNFYKKTTSSVSKSDIEKYLTNLPNVTKENETQWFYQNEDTGAYCSFEYYESDEEDEEENFNGFEDTNFTFNINFIRPQFFGKECFPLVDNLIRDLDLHILNPQGDPEPKKYENGILEKEWGESNLNFAKSNFKEWELSYLELNKSNYSWAFSKNRKSLQNALGDNYFVPGIFYIKKKNTNVVNTLAVWPEHIPYILPEVDYVLVQKKIKKLFRTKKEDGLIKYSELVSKLGSFFVDEKDYKIIHPENANKISKLFNELPLIGGFEDFGEGITVDKFVNTKSK